MAMNPGERSKYLEYLKQFCVESNEPLPANNATFWDENGTLLYAGIISKWPMIIAVDVEWGEVKELDATKEPFAGKTVRFFSPFTGN